MIMMASLHFSSRSAPLFCYSSRRHFLAYYASEGKGTGLGRGAFFPHCIKMKMMKLLYFYRAIRQNGTRRSFFLMARSRVQTERARAMDGCVAAWRDAGIGRHDEAASSSTHAHSAGMCNRPLTAPYGSVRPKPNTASIIFIHNSFFSAKVPPSIRPMYSLVHTLLALRVSET